MRSSSGALRRHVAALSLYAGLALLLTWPLPLHFASHVPGDGIDDPALAWNLWWIKYRLVNQLEPNIFHSDAMFFPIGINLAFYTLTPLNGLLSTPLQTAMNLIVANNLLLLATFILSAYGAFLLCSTVLRELVPAQLDGQRLMRTHTLLYVAALAGGIIYAFASSKLFYASLGQFNICSSLWVPFYVLYMWRAFGHIDRPPLIKDILLAGLFFTFQAWSELTYASFLLIFALLIFVWRLARITSRHARQTRRIASLIGNMALLAFTLVIGLLPFLWAMAPDLIAEGNVFTRGGGFAEVFSSDILGIFVPTRLHPLFGDWVATLPFAGDKGQHLYVGYSILYLVTFALVGRHKAQLRSSALPFFAVCTLIFLLLALGPHVRIGGQATIIPGPFTVVSQLPFFSGNRYPSRYAVMVMLFLSILAAMGLFRLLSVRSQQVMENSPSKVPVPSAVFLPAFVVILIFLFEHLSVPLPLTDFRIPSIYGDLATVSERNPVLELPTGWRNGARVLGRSDELIMMQQWYQTAHANPRLGGNTSRNPEQTFQYFTEAPLLGTLIAVMNADRPHIAEALDADWPALIQANRTLAPEVLDFLAVDYVVLHADKAPPRLLEFVQQVLPMEEVNSVTGPNWEGNPSEMRLYRIQQSASAPKEENINLLASEANLYLANGWSAYSQQPSSYRYATRRQPRMLLDLADEDCIIEFVVHPKSVIEALFVNGRNVPIEHMGSPQRNTVIARVPAAFTGELVDLVEVKFKGQGLNATPFVEPPLTTVDDTLSGYAGTIFVRSAGEEVGNFAHIYVNGIDQIEWSRGYNLVAISMQGAVLDSVTFDTFSSPQAADAMVQWLQQWPAGTIIAGAVADSASLPNGDFLSQDTRDALSSIGASRDLTVNFRWSHAFIGAVGLPPGTALESTSLFQPASVYLGAPVDSDRIWGAISRVRIRYP